MSQNNLIEILMVEDNPDDAELTIFALESGNIVNQIVHVHDGAEAIDFLFGSGRYEGRDLSHRPRLILLDLKLPKLSGLEVLQRIRSEQHTATIPVVVLTSSNQDPDIQRAYQLGCNSYIVKPVDFESFSQTISQLGMYWAVLNTPYIPQDNEKK